MQKEYPHPDQMEETELSLKDIYYVLLRNAKLIFWSVLITLIMTGVYSLWVPPLYTAHATIMIEEPSRGMNVFDMGFSNDMNRLNNEMQILKSRSMAESVIKDLWNSESRNHLYLFGTNRYEPEGLRKIVRKVLSFNFGEDEPLATYSGDIPDTLFGPSVIEFGSALEVSSQRNTNILSVSMSAVDASEATLLVNTLILNYQQRDIELHAGEIINLRSFLEEQVGHVNEDLSLAENKLREFQEAEQIFGLDQNAALLLKELTTIETEYFKLLAEENIAKERKKYFQQQLTQEEKTLSENLLNSINTRVYALRTEIASTESDMVRNASLYGEDHEMVRSGRAKIARLKEQLASQTKDLISRGMAVSDPLQFRQSMVDTVLAFEGQIASIQFRSAEYKKLVTQYNAQLNLLPAKSLKYARLERDRNVLAGTYLLMRQKLEEAKISQASQMGQVRIIDKAIIPVSRSKPKIKMNLILGLLLGMASGVGLAALREYLDNTVKTVEDIEKLHQHVLGIIPALHEDSKDKKKKITSIPWQREVQTIKRTIITKEDPKSPISEAYRSLRTSILYSSPDKPIKSMIISSPGPGEGKTTTTSNLAITFANMGKKTLLIDADLRHPVLHHVFDLEKSPGLTDYLTSATNDFSTLVKATEIKNLFVCTSGINPPNPSELLGSKKMSELIDSLEKDWDIILLDSPPMVAVTDATIVSREIDAMILVVHSGKTDKHSFQRTVNSLKTINVPLVGVVLNSVTSKNSYGSYYYYYQNYNYSHKDNKYKGLINI
ncbi:MAG: polysaccharide biosynthesis tyrosine autokinase [Candidatus Marinimicrobia bacterium]|nr:polysaccharide biosynthesis tyrosine autokinase [Candidatus Neomarinimicrobiota bacterium]